MKKILQLSLGVMTALGGFVDIGELVFTTQAGARFGYSLLWAILMGTIGIMLFSEMSGRIAAVKHEPVFTIVRQRLGYRLGLGTLVASNLVNWITCAAEIGGMAIILQLLFNFGYSKLLVISTLGTIGLVWVLPFKWIERVYGMAGLSMLVFLWVLWDSKPDWHATFGSMVPNVPHMHGAHERALYAYFAVGILSALMMPYEVYFYSSGGIEEEWTRKDLGENKLITTVGFMLGMFLSMSLLMIGAAYFMPKMIFPFTLGTTALSAASTLGRTGLLLALIGMFCCIAGASVETCLAGAYNICQFFGIKWGRKIPEREAPVFTSIWVVFFLISMGIVLAGINPLKLVEYSVIFAVVVLPLTYLAILLAADDKKFMGKHVNSGVIRWLAWIYLGIITVCAVAAVPLMIYTHQGQP